VTRVVTSLGRVRGQFGGKRTGTDGGGAETNLVDHPHQPQVGKAARFDAVASLPEGA